MKNLSVGDLAVWHHLPRGGYGYIHAVPCVVVKITPSRVSIAVRRTTGEVVTRSVKADAIAGISAGTALEIAESIKASLLPRLRLTQGAKA